MATLAELLRQGADKLVNLPSEAQRFITNPQAFTQLLTGKNPLPRETGFAAGATGLPPTEMSVLDPNQAAYMQGYTQGEPIGYAGMAAPFAAPAALATGKALAPKLGQVTENYMVKQGMIQPLTAYHGTPHTIQGQFDINKVGTGEGNQTFGHGIYFAEEPKVAKMYQASLSDTKYLSGGKELKGNEAWAAQFLHDFQGDALPKRVDVDTAISKANQTLKDTDTKKEIINNIKALDKSGLSVENGNLYKVDIPDADIPLMLDYDKPFEKQSKEVKEILKSSGLYKQYKQNLSDFSTPMQTRNKNARGENIQAFVEHIAGSPEKASEMLNSLGIKGIRYLDEGSRKAGKGTSNFVVFDPSNVKILEKNDKPVTRKELIEKQVKALKE